MKKLTYVLTVVAFIFCFMVTAEAATTSTIQATAAVTSELNLTASVFRVDSKNTDAYTDDTWDATPTTTMSFGTLTHTLSSGAEAGCLFARPYYYVALLGGFSSGRKYRIQSTSSGLIGPATITKGFSVTYLDGDPKQADGTSINPTAMSGTLGTAGLAAVTNKVLYDSGFSGAARVIGAYFGIPPTHKLDGSEAYPGYHSGGNYIPVDTLGGSYSGNVTFSIVLY